MPHAALTQEPLGRLAGVLAENGFRLLAAAAALLSLGLGVVPAAYAAPVLAAGATCASLAAIGQALVLRRAVTRRAAVRGIAGFADHDPTPCMVTSPEGEVRYVNLAARKRFRPEEGTTLAQMLGDLFANPSGVLFRLQEKALALGGAREDVVTRRGHVRLTVLEIGAEGFLWRFDEVAEARSSARGAEALSLPMLIASRTGTVLFMNEALRNVLGGRAKHLDRILNDLPLRPGDLHEIAAAQGALLCRVAEVEGPGGRRELYFLPAGPAPQPGTAAASEIEDLPVAVLQLTAAGDIGAANRLARALLGAEDDEDLAGQALSDRLEGLGRPLRDWLADAAQGRSLGRPEVLRVHGAATERFVQVVLGRVAGPGEVRLLAVMNDATELKTLEAQVVQSQKMQAIGQLAGGVAHDFNNLLTAISGHCDLMLLRHGQGDPDYGDLVQIHQNANRAAALVGQLLAFSRKQTMQPQVIDLRDTLSDLTHLLNRLVGERVTLTLNHEGGLPAIRADRRQLEQVIMNLVVNARDAMPDGGEIRIETQSLVIERELLRERAKVPPGRYVVVKVEDHGVGIPADKIPKIFEPFYTTKRTGEGTGLGLSTAYGIVKQSGGFIFVDSVPGVGTAFTLYFPAHERSAELAPPPPARTAASVPWRPVAPPAPRAPERGRDAAAPGPALPAPATALREAPAGARSGDPAEADTPLRSVMFRRAARPGVPGVLGLPAVPASAAPSGPQPGPQADLQPGGSPPDPAAAATTEPPAGPLAGPLPEAAGSDAAPAPAFGLGTRGIPDTAGALPAQPGPEGFSAGLPDQASGPDPAADDGRTPPAEAVAEDAPPDRSALRDDLAQAGATDPAAGATSAPARDAADEGRAATETSAPLLLPPLARALPEPGQATRSRPGHAADPLAGGSGAGTAPAGASGALAGPIQGRAGDGVILLVEDEAPVRAFASRALRMRGYTVIEAENAEEALRTLEDRSLRVDVFVTDVIMPGMDGPSWVRKALETRPNVKVVFVSGYAEDSFGEEQSRIPNSVFLPKPFSLSDLAATVQDQIH